MKPSTSGQAARIEEALHAYERPLLRYAASITGDIESARDVVQETFIKLCESDSVKVENHLAAWLYTVARNRALNVRKKEARMTPLLEGCAEALSDGRAGPGELAQARETVALVAEALAGLSASGQEACRLKFQNGLNYREISQVMGVSLGTVSNLITHGLEAIRVKLRASGKRAGEA